MSNWLRARRGKKPEPETAAGEEPHSLQREAQELRLKLAESERRAAQLTAELARQRGGAGGHLADAVRAQVEPLLAAAAGPASQLLTQAHLMEVEGKPVAAKDVLAIARRLVRALEEHGLTLEGRVGETAPFDPDRHEPLSREGAPARGQPVVVRFVAVAYQGKLLRKAGVQPEEG